MADGERDLNPLSLYIQYEFLPSGQLGAVLTGVEEVYVHLLRAIANTPDDEGNRLLTLSSYFLWHPRRSEHELALGPPLVVDSAATGESIIFKFDTEKRVLPGLLLKDGDLQVLLPKWSAAAVLVGAALTSSLHGYNQYLEAQKNHLEVRKLQIEVARMEREERARDALRSAEYAAQRVRAELAKPNIVQATANGVNIPRPNR